MIKTKIGMSSEQSKPPGFFYLEMSDESSVRDHDLKKVLLPLSLHHVNNDNNNNNNNNNNN